MSLIEHQRRRASLSADAPTVLIAEDFDDFRFMLRLRLELSGYKVVEAVNGREAVEVALRERPGIVLMDMNMPVLDGFAAARRMREQPALCDVPIVAITAYGTADYRNKTAAAGCNEFLTKPLDFARLEEVMTRLLTVRVVAA